MRKTQIFLTAASLGTVIIALAVLAAYLIVQSKTPDTNEVETAVFSPLEKADMVLMRQCLDDAIVVYNQTVPWSYKVRSSTNNTIKIGVALYLSRTGVQF
jgi:hypothetical protein